MANTFDCPNCGQKLTAKPEMAGVFIDCPSCGSQIQVPSFEAPVPMAPQPQQSYPRQMAPSPYGQMAPQPYPQQMPPQQPYGYAPQTAPKSNMGVVTALIVVLVIVSAAFGAYFLFGGERTNSSANSSSNSSSNTSNTSRVTTEEDRVKRVVTAMLMANKRGDYGSEYWATWKSSERFIAPTSWEIVNISVYGSSATVVTRVDSSNKLGMKITKLWKIWLTKETGSWKVFSIDDN